MQNRQSLVLHQLLMQPEVNWERDGRKCTNNHREERYWLWTHKKTGELFRLKVQTTGRKRAKAMAMANLRKFPIRMKSTKFSTVIKWLAVTFNHRRESTSVFSPANFRRTKRTRRHSIFSPCCRRRIIERNQNVQKKTTFHWKKKDFTNKAGKNIFDSYNWRQFLKIEIRRRLHKLLHKTSRPEKFEKALNVPNLTKIHRKSIQLTTNEKTPSIFQVQVDNFLNKKKKQII